MDALKKLQYLSMVNKVVQELSNHIGLQNRDLAEFIINLAESSPTVEAFQQQVAQFDQDLAPSFTAHLYNLVSKMNPNKVISIMQQAAPPVASVVSGKESSSVTAPPASYV